jgi:acetoin:2,6-dichlorophenolindophenol oxidoreductase subunit alpha
MSGTAAVPEAADRRQPLWMYATMATSRYFEERMAAIYLEGKQPVFDLSKGPIPGEMHLSNGQEPCAVGVCAHLHPEDALSAGHRLHHFAIAKGVDLREMTAEIFGKRTGLSGGRGGHMHLFDRRVNFGSSGIVGQGMSMALGAALAFKMRGDPHVAVAVIGEGAANAGLFHEALNLAALWRLPFICVIEDNGWAVTVSKEESTAVRRNDVRAAAYGIPGEYVGGNDPYAVSLAAASAVRRARAGEGPSLIEIQTLRLAGHFQGDTDGYRSAQEKARMLANDPLPLMRARLLAESVGTAAELDELEKSGRRAVDDAIEFARTSPLPEPAEALERVFV